MPEPLVSFTPPDPLPGAVRGFTRGARLLTRRRLALALSLGARGLEAAAKFGLYALAARALGGPDAGRFFLALSLIHIVSTIARMGLERPLTRHVASELAVGDPRAALRAARDGCGAVLAASILAAVTLAGAAPWIATSVLGQPELSAVLTLAALAVPLQNLAYALAHVLIGLERGAAAQMVMNTLAPALSLGALALWADDLHNLLAVYAASFGLCALLGLALIAASFPRRRGRTQRQTVVPTPSLWQGAAPLWVVEISQAALLSIPVLALGAFATPAAVSVFSICSRLSMLVTTVVLSLGALSAPAFAGHHRLGDWPALRAAVQANRRVTILLTLPLLAALAIGSGPILGLLGIAATEGMPVLLILLVGQLVFCLLPSRDLLLAMAGQGLALRRLSLWQLAACAVLSLCLVPPLAALGAAVASAAIWIGGTVAVALSARRRLPELAL